MFLANDFTYMKPTSIIKKRSIKHKSHLNQRKKYVKKKLPKKYWSKEFISYVLLFLITSLF
jgi:hypothetical protein